MKKIWILLSVVFMLSACDSEIEHVFIVGNGLADKTIELVFINPAPQDGWRGNSCNAVRLVLSPGEQAEVRKVYTFSEQPPHFIDADDFDKFPELAFDIYIGEEKNERDFRGNWVKEYIPLRFFDIAGITGLPKSKYVLTVSEELLK